MGRLPVLELDDGSHLTESLAIIEYIEELHPEPAMIGREPGERARVRNLERIIDLGVLLPIGRVIHATNSPLGLPPNPELAKAGHAALKEGLGFLDDEVGARPFVAGDTVTVADCTLFAAFFFAGFGELEIPAQYENLQRWHAAFRERPSAEAASRRPPRESV